MNNKLIKIFTQENYNYLETLSIACKEKIDSENYVLENASNEYLVQYKELQKRFGKYHFFQFSNLNILKESVPEEFIKKLIDEKIIYRYIDHYSPYRKYHMIYFTSKGVNLIDDIIKKKSF